MFMVALFIIVKIIMNREDMVYIYNIYNGITTWMNLLSITLSKISHTGKDKYCYHLHMESKKIKQINIYNKTDS